MGIEQLTHRLKYDNLSSCTEVLRILTNPNRVKEYTVDEVNFACNSVSKIIAGRRNANNNDVVWVSIKNHRDEFLQSLTGAVAKSKFIRVFKSIEDDTLKVDENDLVIPKDFQSIIGVHGYSNGSDELEGFAWLTSIVDNHQRGFITPIDTELQFGSR